MMNKDEKGKMKVFEKEEIFEKNKNTLKLKEQVAKLEEKEEESQEVNKEIEEENINDNN